MNEAKAPGKGTAGPMVIGFYGNVTVEDPMHDHEPQSLSGLAGGLPLAAYLFPGETADRFPIAAVLMLITLFVVGALRSLVTRVGG